MSESVEPRKRHDYTTSGVIIYGVVHEGNGTIYCGSLSSASAVATGIVAQEPEGSVWVERYTVRKLTKGTLLSALGDGRGWADSIKRERTIR